jgi:hypothetical protein
VAAYVAWIDHEGERIPALPAHLQAQARRHVERCRLGAKRMSDGVVLIQKDEVVRRAFQVAQLAMATQFGRSRQGAALQWRPFQLGFQLLVLQSLADKQHCDRDTMDPSWFPTGGGKTEAYLALTAFVIVLRRLRAQDGISGAGVAVLMRHTLRLLTVQQFQRGSRFDSGV